MLPTAEEMYGEWAAPWEPGWRDLPDFERDRWGRLADWVQDRTYGWKDECDYE